MTTGEALRAIRENARSGHIEITPHARLRMQQRAITFAEVAALLSNATTVTSQPTGEWRVTARSSDVTAIVVVTDDDVVVTTWR